MTRAATSSPICRRRATASGCAATASSIRPRCRPRPASSLDLRAAPAPNASAAAQILSADLLVLDDPRAEEGANFRWRRSRARASGSTSSRAALASHAIRSARREPGRSAKQFSDQFAELVRCLGAAARLRQRAGVHGARHRQARHRRRRSTCSAIGLTGSKAVNCRSPSPSGRRASSAIWSSPCGTGAIRHPICTMPSRPTVAIRGSTRTARSTARRRTAPT